MYSTRSAQRIEDIDFLGQGTIYPDVIESAIRTWAFRHHQIASQCGWTAGNHETFSLVEPLRLLFKDEVRKVGSELGIPHDVLFRHPFPGPGLGHPNSWRSDRRKGTVIARSRCDLYQWP